MRTARLLTDGEGFLRATPPHSAQHCEQNESQTGVKTLPCPKPRLWVVKIT